MEIRVDVVALEFMRSASNEAGSLFAVKPRLLIVSPCYPPASGGIETLATHLASALTGFDTRVLTLHANGSGYITDDVPVRRLRNVPVGGRRSLLRLNGALGIELLRDTTDVVLSLHVRAAPAVCLSRPIRSIPLVQYVHAKEMLEFPETARFTLERAQSVIAVSRYAGELARAAGASLDAVTVIPNGVDPAPARVRSPDSPPTIVTVSRLVDEYKGHDIMMEALPAVRRAVPTVRWVVVGDGTLRARLELDAARRGLSEIVEFVGEVDDDTRNCWLDQATVFVMPTREPGPGKAGEGFGIVFLEAAARGVPSVAGRVPGVVDAVEDGVSGILVDPCDPDAVAAATIRLLTDTEFAARMGSEARRRSRDFDWPSVARRVDGVLRAAIADGPRVHHARGNRLAFAREFLLGPRS
jgi:phosphatidylinositol alpha-1,6-mannosyltransferase